MLQNTEPKEETERATENLDKLVLDAIKGLVYESHEEHVDYDESGQYGEAEQQQSGGGGGSSLPMLGVGIAFFAVGYAMGRRSRSGDMMGGDASSRIQGATDKAASRTEELAESTAGRVRESGQDLSERTESTATDAADRLDEGSQELGDQIEEGGSEAADEMEDTGSDAADEMDDSSY